MSKKDECSEKQQGQNEVYGRTVADARTEAMAHIKKAQTIVGLLQEQVPQLNDLSNDISDIVKEEWGKGSPQYSIYDEVEKYIEKHKDVREDLEKACAVLLSIISLETELSKKSDDFTDEKIDEALNTFRKDIGHYTKFFRNTNTYITMLQSLITSMK